MIEFINHIARTTHYEVKLIKNSKLPAFYKTALILYAEKFLSVIMETKNYSPDTYWGYHGNIKGCNIYQANKLTFTEQLQASRYLVKFSQCTNKEQVQTLWDEYVNEVYNAKLALPPHV